MKTQTKTHEEVRQAFDEVGLSLREWATAHGLNYEIAKAVLQGKLAGRRGEAHKVAVALGLKTGKVVEAVTFLPPPVKRRQTFAAVKGGRA